MVGGFDDDLPGEATRIANRLRGLLAQIHLHLERALGPRIDHPAVLGLLERFGSPAALPMPDAAVCSVSPGTWPRACSSASLRTSSPRLMSRPSSSPAPRLPR
ncbi:hypothetical protein KNE206_57320 [Kitasatospora sp. NE20-6]